MTYRACMITGPDYAKLILLQLPIIPPRHVIIEPVSRDTAAAVAYAMVYVGQRARDAVMVVMPSDHVVLDGERFAETLTYTAKLASIGNYLVTKCGDLGCS